MPIIQKTSAGSNFLQKQSTSADRSLVSAVQLYEKYFGSNGGSGNTVFSLTKPYLPESYTLLVFRNGQKLELDVDYAETNALTVTTVDAMADTDVIEFMVMGSYRVTSDALESALLSLPGRDNFLINGDFPFWQRGTSSTFSGYTTDDRWGNYHSTMTGLKTHSRQAFTPGQTEVPGNPKYFSRTMVGTNSYTSSYAIKMQRIASVYTLAGETAVLSFYAKASVARDIAVEFIQNFGTSGSTAVTGIGVTKVGLTTEWKRYTVILSIPSISGKTISTEGDDFLEVRFWFTAGSIFDSRTNSLGNQTGTFDLSRIKLQPGAVATPFVPRIYAQELVICQSFFEKSYLVDVAPGTSTPVGLFAGYDVATSSSTSYGSLIIPFKVRKRDSSPTVTFYRRDGTGTAEWRLNYVSYVPVYANTISDAQFNVRLDGESGVTNGDIISLDGHWVASSEL